MVEWMVVGAEVPDGITAKSTGRAASSTLIPGVGSGGAYEREGLIADPTCNLGVPGSIRGMIRGKITGCGRVLPH